MTAFDNVLDQCLAVAAGEEVVLLADEGTDPDVVTGLSNGITQRDATPLIALMPSPGLPGAEPPGAVAAMMLHATATIELTSLFIGSSAARRAATDRGARYLAMPGVRLDTFRPGGPLAVVREELREVASVQFGRSAAERLFSPPVRLAGRPWFQRLTDGRTDLATLREERGLFHLTVAGARRLAPAFPLAVEADPALPLTGDLFVPGVRSADPAIRIGDSVVLLRGGALAAVGEAALPGPLMSELERGLAVRVRHREHRRTDMPMTEEGSPSEDGPVV